MIQGGEPMSFYVSPPSVPWSCIPIASGSPTSFSQLHADLWSDWYGALHRNWHTPTGLDHVTAS